MTKLQSFPIQNCVRLLWNPGHSNIEGNEMADSLAKQAATTDFTCPEPVLGLSVTSVRNTVCQWSVQEQNRKWNIIQSCRQAKQLLQNNGSHCAKYAVRLSRKDLKMLVGLLTGHNTLNRHLTLLKIEEDPMCPLCGEEYDTNLHLLGRCSALVSVRNEENSLENISYFQAN